jgi:hypothetical protein
LNSEDVPVDSGADVGAGDAATVGLSVGETGAVVVVCSVGAGFVASGVEVVELQAAREITARDRIIVFIVFITFTC